MSKSPDAGASADISSTDGNQISDVRRIGGGGGGGSHGGGGGGVVQAAGTKQHTAATAKVEAAETYRYIINAAKAAAAAAETAATADLAGAAADVAAGANPPLPSMPSSRGPPRSIRKRAANLLDVVDDVRGSTKLARYDHKAVADAEAARTALTGAEPPPPSEPIISKLAARNNERLVYLSRQLINPATFDSAMAEFGEWCADARAFDPITAASLHACMHSVRQYAEQAATRTELGRCHTCFEGCMRFEGIMMPEMSNQIRLWCEEVLTLRLHRELVVNHDYRRRGSAGARAAASTASAAAAAAAAAIGSTNNSAGNPPDIEMGGTNAGTAETTAEMHYTERDGCSLIMILHIEGKDLDIEQLGAYMYIRAALDEWVFAESGNGSSSGAVRKIKYDDQRIFAYSARPEDALRAALKTQLIVKSINGRFARLGKVSVSIGIEHGSLLLMPGDYFGDPVNVASKLGEDTAKGGDLFVSSKVAGLLSTSKDCKVTWGALTVDQRSVTISHVTIDYANLTIKPGTLVNDMLPAFRMPTDSDIHKAAKATQSVQHMLCIQTLVAPTGDTSAREELMQHKKDCVMLQSDMSGFTRLTKAYGILHFLGLVETCRAIFKKHLAKYNGKVVKYDGDNVIASFATSLDAVHGVRAIHNDIALYNDGRETDFQVRIKLGMSHGSMLIIGHDIAGEAWEDCCTLGEDTAEVGEVLVTESVWNDLTHAPADEMRVFDFDARTTAAPGQDGTGTAVADSKGLKHFNLTFKDAWVSPSKRVSAIATKETTVAAVSLTAGASAAVTVAAHASADVGTDNGAGSSASVGAGAGAGDCAVAAKSVWGRTTDKVTGRDYWWHRVTKTVQWVQEGDGLNAPATVNDDSVASTATTATATTAAVAAVAVASTAPTTVGSAEATAVDSTNNSAGNPPDIEMGGTNAGTAETTAEMHYTERDGCSLIMILHIEGKDLDIEQLGAYMYIRAALDEWVFAESGNGSSSGAVRKIKYDDQRIFAYSARPEDALRAALKTQLIVKSINGRFARLGKVSVSIGIEHGSLLLMPGDYFGDPVNVASKLGEDTAKGGDLFVSSKVAGLLSTSKDCKVTWGALTVDQRSVTISHVTIDYANLTIKPGTLVNDMLPAFRMPTDSDIHKAAKATQSVQHMLCIQTLVAPTGDTSAREELMQHKKDCVMLQSDMSGFTRLTKAYGILHFLGLVETCRAIFKKHLAKYNGKVVKYDGDNVIASFATSLDAVHGVRAIHNDIALYNDGRETDFQVRIKLGMSHGSMLIIGHDIAGEAWEDCCTLGEDTAEVGEVLVTESVWNDLTHAPADEMRVFDFDARTTAAPGQDGTGTAVADSKGLKHFNLTFKDAWVSPSKRAASAAKGGDGSKSSEGGGAATKLGVTDTTTPAPTPVTTATAPTHAPTPSSNTPRTPVLVEQVGEPVLGPFTLQHKAVAHTIGVSIGQPLLAMVASRPDLDLVLRCTHSGLGNNCSNRSDPDHDDDRGYSHGHNHVDEPNLDSHNAEGQHQHRARGRSSKHSPLSSVSFKNETWPNVGLMLSINGHGTVKPQPMDGLLFVTSMLNVGLNVIRMKTPKCCCMHKFELLVAQTLNHDAVRKACLLRSVDVATSLAYVRQMKPPKSRGSFTATSGGGSNSGGAGGSVQRADPRMKTSLRCPISYQRMAIPVRGNKCHHFQCFDLDSYLEKGAADGCWQCPICNKPTATSSLVRDDFMSLILANADSVPASSARCPGMDMVFVHAFYPENWQQCSE